MKIRTKLIFIVGIVVLLTFGGTIMFVNVQARKMENNTAEELVGEMAYHYGTKLQANLEVAMDAARTLAYTFEGIMHQNIVDQKNYPNGKSTWKMLLILNKE